MKYFIWTALAFIIWKWVIPFIRTVRFISKHHVANAFLKEIELTMNQGLDLGQAAVFLAKSKEWEMQIDKETSGTLGEKMKNARGKFFLILCFHDESCVVIEEGVSQPFKHHVPRLMKTYKKY